MTTRPTFAQQVLIELDFSYWQTWLPLVIFAAVLGYFLGRSSRRRTEKPRARTPARTRVGLPGGAMPLPEPEAPPPGTDPLLQGSYGERRGSLRRSGKSVKVAVADAKLDAVEPAWVADRSTGGLGLYMERTMEPGIMLYVRPWEGLDSIPWVQVTVRSCQAEEDGWKVGCQFVKTPPWSILLLFG